MLNSTKESTTTTTPTNTMDVLLSSKTRIAAITVASDKTNTPTNENRKTPNSTPTHKSTLKSNIFSWLKSATAASTTSTNGNNKTNQCHNTQRFSAPPQWMRARNTSTSSPSADAISFLEFRGVQSLRHLWNKRISANAAEAIRNNNKHNNNRGKLTKSISCLVNTNTECNNEINEDNSNNIKSSNADAVNTFQRVRAQSLYDCRVFGIGNDSESDNSKNSNNQLTTDHNEDEIDSLHRVKDNFYKYKTAEQASVHLARATAITTTVITSCSGGSSSSAIATTNSNNNNNGGSTHFPAYTRCEIGAGHIHWTKRNEIINSGKRRAKLKKVADLEGIMAVKDRQSATTTNTTTKSTTTTTTATAITTNEVLSTMSDVISDCGNAETNTIKSFDMDKRQTEEITKTTITTEDTRESGEWATGDMECNEIESIASFSPASSDVEETNNSLTPANDSEHCLSPAVRIERKSTAAHFASSETNKSNANSSTSSPTLTSGGGRKVTARRTASNGSSNAASVRKYSFKTHTRNYITPRKMHHNHRSSGDHSAIGSCNSGTGASTPSVTSNGGSIVARLTQQFNEIIQKDKTLLKEVKRKNGVLLTRGGHVYKVIEKNEGRRKHVSPSISRTSSRSSRDLMTTATMPTTMTNGTVATATTTSSPYASIVKKTIRKFEIEAKKPELPVAREAVKHNNDGNSDVGSFIKRKNLRLPLDAQQQQQQQIDDYNIKTSSTTTATTTMMTSKKQPPHTLLITQPTLEVVREEARTPLDNDDKKIVNETCSNNEKQLISRNVDCGPIITETPIEDVEPTKAMNMVNEKTNLNGTQTTSVESVDGVTLKSPKLSPKNTTYESISARQRYKKKCAKIYEKFRLFSPFDNGGNSSKPPTTSMPVISTTIEVSMPLTSTSTSPSPIPSPSISECKLLDAIEACDEKLKHIIDSADKSSPVKVKESPSPSSSSCSLEPLTSNNDFNSANDFEKHIIPNTSFVHHHSSGKQVKKNQLILPQAVNVSLVNSIEGEQMIMEQKELKTQSETSAVSCLKLAELTIQPITNNSTYTTSIITNTTIDDETIYESINSNENQLNKKKTELKSTPNSFIYKCQQKVQTNVLNNENFIDDIYQTVEEVRQQQLMNSLNDYESIAGSCEQNPAKLLTTKTITTMDGYELYEPSQLVVGKIADATVVPASPTSPTVLILPTMISTTTGMIRNTNDELPELPKPKRRLPKSPMPGKREPKVINSIRTPQPLLEPTIPSIAQHAQDIDEQHYYADDENIYDTIKGSHCYESLNSNNNRLQKTASMTSSVERNTIDNPIMPADSLSLTSNCYERITQYRRVVVLNNIDGVHATGSRCGSTLTISSDHKTNSLYEAPLVTGFLYPNGNNLIRACTSSSSAASSDGGIGDVAGDVLKPINTTNANGDIFAEHADGIGLQKAISSDNSDEWIDMSESDTEGGEKQQFVVIRERQKVHRSPDWSKRVRDKRLQTTSAESCIEDDSDHYYETLSPLGCKRHSTPPSMQQQSQNQTLKINNDHPISHKTELIGEKTAKKSYGHGHGLGNSAVSDDYDSFDSSIDEVFDVQSDGLRKDYNDSGVDIRNVKLPEPPSSTNQVYAIVKKLKKFISNKKSPSSTGTGVGSGVTAKSSINNRHQKLYENTSQFYVEENLYRNTPKSKSLPKLNLRKAPARPPSLSQEDYENSEFHTSTNVLFNSVNDGSKPSQAIVESSNSQQQQQQNQYTTKTKSGKSLRSRIHKSLGGSTTEVKHIPSLTPTRSTFYIEDPSICGYGELDSGFSEKASSGDLPTQQSTSTESQKFSTVARKGKKEAKSNQRRRTVIGLRPHDPPPPPPPLDLTIEKMKSERSSKTSWYTECGVFKNGLALPNDAIEDVSLSTSKNTILNQTCSLTPTATATTTTTTTTTSANNSSWYAEAGLYQTSGVSVASSSGSSGVSTGNEAGLGDELAHSFFMNEPLYQIYNAEKLESITRDMEDTDSSTDGYEEIGQNSSNNDNNASKCDDDRQKQPRLSAFQLIGPKVGPARTLWSEIPEVINSCVLLTLTPRERALQEAKFEILTSEASYLKSLNLLRSHFMNHPVFRDTAIVSSRDRKALFSNIVPVHECSERLLTEMEACWQDNIMLLGLSKRIYAIAEKHFRVYIDFCEHQGRMDRTLRRLKNAKGIFSQNLVLLESNPTCCGLNLHSFLMLPMQRITRLPLLIDAVFSKVHPNDDEYDSWKMTLAIMNKIVAQCNDAANRCEQAYEIERISRQLEFPSIIRALAIAPVGVPATGSKPRYLVKKGELTQLIWRGDDAKLTFGRKITKSTIFAFLFSDLLVLAKRKSEEQFTVFDYCPRNMLTISSGNALPQLPTKDLNQTGKNLILMTLLENYEQKTVELVLSCPSVSEQERWLQTMRLPKPETPGEKLYEQWDCPQVITKHAYKAHEPDALDLDVGDVVNVMRKLPDGWYQGERIRDGATGWFPGSFTEEVNSVHVRARNLKQRHRLLTFTATYLESRKQK